LPTKQEELKICRSHELLHDTASGTRTFIIAMHCLYTAYLK